MGAERRTGPKAYSLQTLIDLVEGDVVAESGIEPPTYGL
jgi:hypothetical protein